MAKDMYQKRRERQKNKKNETYDEKKTNINWYPGHMAKTKREIKEKLNLIDIVYEVIDARMPLSSKINDIDDLIGNKSKILVMTKYDICDKNETDKFIDYYESLGYKVIPVNLLTGENVSKIIEYSKIIMQKENDKRKAKGMKPRSLRALVLGVPNAGKSTLINRLVGKKSAGVGNRPGVTKSLSWIRINKDIELLDSPGILWPKFEDQEQAHILAALSSIKEEILEKEDLARFIFNRLEILYPEKLKERYKLETISTDMIENYDMVAESMKAFSKGGVTDYEKVYNIILRDLKSGLFGNVTFDRLK